VDQRSAIGTLEEELEFYDLLNDDAPAEEDVDPDLDDTVASFFEM